MIRSPSSKLGLDADSVIHQGLNSAAIDRGKLFRRLNKAGKTWGDGMTKKIAVCSQDSVPWFELRRVSNLFLS